MTETSLTLGFDQAKDDELVNYYEVEITDQAGEPVAFTANQVPDFGKNAPKSRTGSFKAYSRFYMTPNTMGFDIQGLKAAKNYTVKVTAFDDFENPSESLTGVVRTAGGAAAAAAPAAAAVGSVSYVDTDRRGVASALLAAAGGAFWLRMRMRRQ